MQEESAESLHSSVFVWPCPLCQQGRTDRDALAQHLTDKHSVLPACLERLLDTATPEHRAVSGVAEGETDTQNKETDGAASDSETDTNTATPTQSTADPVLRGSRARAGPRAEREGEGEGEREQEGKDSLKPDQERILHPESTKSRKGPPRTAVSGDSSSDASSVTKSTSTSKATSDPALEKFLDPNRPFKCNACLESFPSKSALGVHYSSTSHLHRMRTGSAKQGDESDTSSVPITTAPHPTRPFISNKPYQCAVCRVSYNHAFTLESHMKSVLHQTRSRNAVNVAGNSDKKGIGNSGNTTTATSAVNTAFGNSAPNSVTSSVVSASNSVGVNTSSSGIQRSIGAKDTELNQSQSVSSSCPPSAPPLSLLSSSATSTQAVSAFLTLLTSSSHPISPSLQSSLFAANTGAASSAAAPQLELIARQQLLLPLFLNGLQTQTQNQNQNSNLESSSALLTQSVPLLGLSAAQQALLAQRLGCLQSPSSGTALPTAAHTCAEEEETKDGAPRLKREVSKEESCPGNGAKMLGDGLLMLESETEEKGTSGPVTVKKEISELDGTLESEDAAVNKDQGEAAKEKGAVGKDFVEKLECVEEREEPGDESTTSCDAGDQLHCEKLPATSDTILSLGDNTHSATPSPRVSPNPSHNSKSCSPALNPNSCLPTPTVAGLKCPNPSSDRPVLTEFQSQVLWAFLESRCEADAASPPREDCEALGREVGLSEEEVRRWLGDARETRERQKSDAAKTVLKKMEGDRTAIEEKEDVRTVAETEGGQSPAISCHAIDLSNNGERGREREYGRESPGESCLTSDSDNDGFYTSVIVTDEESQNSSFQEEAASPVREEAQSEEKAIGGGKVLRSSTVFLSDAEDTEDEEEGGPQKVKRRKRKREVEEVEVKKERPDPDVDLELEAQAESPPSTVSVEQQSLPGVLHPLPLSLSLAPFTTQFLNPYVLSLPSSTVGLGIAEGDGDRDRGRAPVFQNPPAITRCSAPFLDALKTPPPASHMSPARSLSNGGICESALDLSMGKKKHGATSAASSSTSTGNKTGVQRDHKLDGLELRSTAQGVPAAGGLIVVRVKPDSALAVPNPNSGIHSNNNAKTSTVYIRAAERVNASMMEKEKGPDGEAESRKQQKHPKARRYRDMRRSRTIIQTEQLDVLYGCYFKDPNPGKHEFERISEWVHLPKKVVQIWFQNMRARERKGEVRFISDGTLAAVGKPLIKFTWPLTLPIFTSSPNQNTSSLSSSGIAKVSAEANTGSGSAKPKPDKEQVKEEKESKPKEVGAASSVAHLSVPKVSKPKPETLNRAAASKTVSKSVAAAPAVPVVMKTRSAPLSHQSQKRRRGKEEECGAEEEKTDDEDEEQGKEKIGPGTTNRMVPKISSTSASKSLTPSSQKRNGLNDWSPKGPIKVNTLSREQLGLSSAHPPVITTIPVSTPTNANIIAKPTPQDGACLHHSTPRRPRTHLTSLQVSIMQSCYETCPHPNALECEKMGAELGLPLKVVQIWFQNTRAKEKRWRLQLQKQSASSTDSSKKVDTSSGSFLLYNALRANRPILPKPVQLTVMEPSAPPGVGQPAGRETLRGRCDACGVEFESREAGRTHVFSPQHLATLRSTNFGQPPSLVNKGSGTGSSLSSGAAVQSSPSPASSTS